MDQNQPQRYRIPLWFYTSVPNRLAAGLISALTPLFIVQVLHGSLADVGWAASATSLASAPASIWWGNISDRVGRRLPFMLVGLASFAIFTLLTGLAYSVPAVLLYSFFGSLLGTASGPAASALLIEGVPEKQWPVSFGWFNQIGGVSFVAGMLIGSLWLQYLPRLFSNDVVMRGLFLLAGGMALASPIIAVFWVKEAPIQSRFEPKFTPRVIGRLVVRMAERALFHVPPPWTLFRQPFQRNWRKTLTSSLGRYFLYTFLLFFGINVAFLPFPVYLSQVLKASNGQVFLINLVKSLVDTFFYVPMGHWMVRRRGIGLQAQAAAVRVLLFMACGYLALVSAGQSGLPIIVIVQILNGMTWAAISVSGPTAVAVLSAKGTEARAIGTYNAIIGLAGVTGNLAAGYLVQWKGYVFSFSTAAVLMLLTALFMWRLRSQAESRGDPRTTQELVAAKEAGD